MIRQPIRVLAADLRAGSHSLRRHGESAVSIDRRRATLDGDRSAAGPAALKRITLNRAGQVYVSTSAGVWRYTTSFRDILVDGGFESGSGWDMPATPRPAHYSDDVIFSGRQSLHI